MKNVSILLTFASLGLAAVGARSANSDESSGSIQLPAYTVIVPRQSPVEQQIERSLDDFCATARTPLRFKTRIPLLSAGTKARHRGIKATPLLAIAGS